MEVMVTIVVVVMMIVGVMINMHVSTNETDG